MTKFRKHKLESNKIFLLDDMVAHDDEYYKNKEQVELEKKEKARAKKEAAQAKRQVKEEQKKRLQEEREEKKRKKEAADEAAAKRRRQTRCHYCPTGWKGSDQWKWCDHCDDVGICPGCQNDPIRFAEFELHEDQHANQ